MSQASRDIILAATEQLSQHPENTVFRFSVNEELLQWNLFETTDKIPSASERLPQHPENPVFPSPVNEGFLRETLFEKSSLLTWSCIFIPIALAGLMVFLTREIIWNFFPKIAGCPAATEPTTKRKGRPRKKATEHPAAETQSPLQVKNRHMTLRSDTKREKERAEQEARNRLLQDTSSSNTSLSNYQNCTRIDPVEIAGSNNLSNSITGQHC